MDLLTKTRGDKYFYTTTQALFELWEEKRELEKDLADQKARYKALYARVIDGFKWGRSL